MISRDDIVKLGQVLERAQKAEAELEAARTRIAALLRESTDATEQVPQGLSQEDREHAVKVPRRLVERAMESCQVNNDHEAWYALLWVLDPACIREEMLDRVQDFLRRLGGQTT